MTYVKNPYKAETFAEENLRNTVKLINDFAILSGLHANLDKTMESHLVGPLVQGHMTSSQY